MKKTVVLGASPNPSRFSHRMVTSLVRHNLEVVAVGNRPGVIAGQDILIGMPEIPDVHTVTLYLGPARQPAFYDYIISLKPARIIFNPGTYNPELEKLAQKHGIETRFDCALVMLAQERY